MDGIGDLGIDWTTCVLSLGQLNLVFTDADASDLNIIGGGEASSRFSSAIADVKDVIT